MKLWKTERTRHLGAQARYLDGPALKSMRRFGLKPALAAGHIWVDVAAAIYAHAGERSTAPPWKIHEWADAARAKRLDDEQAQRAIEEREQRDRQRVTDDRADHMALRAKYPGKSMREIVELEARAGGMRPLAALLPHLRLVDPAEAAS